MPMLAFAQKEANKNNPAVARKCESQLSPNSEVAYLGRLDTHISKIVGAKPSMRFSELCSQCLGAWPGLVLQRLAALGLEGLAANSQVSSRANSYNPELHLLASEWYFTPEATAALVENHLSSPGAIALLGCPSIARHLRATGRRSVLLDSNELLVSRFPELGQWLRKVDLNTVLTVQERGYYVALDPPWYVPVILRWLSLASNIAEEGGQIIMPLLQPGTRPSASDDRRAILSFAKKIGEVSVAHDCMSFETPLFEAEALMACGVGTLPAWRRSDLLVITRTRPTAVLPPLHSYSSQVDWKTFVLGPQVVKLRLGQGLKDFALRSLNRDGSFVLNTVSARDSRFHHVGLWSSRNRIAEVGNEIGIALALDYLTSHPKRIRARPPTKKHIAEILGCDKAADDLLRFLLIAPPG